MKKQKKQYDDDDGRVVTNMNVDGMPWYVEKASSESKNTGDGKIQLTKQEEHAMFRGVVLATLLVTAVFVIGALLFILFCTNIWFK